MNWPLKDMQRASFSSNVDSAEGSSKTPDTTDLALTPFIWIWLQQEGVCQGLMCKKLPVAFLIGLYIVSGSDRR